MAQASACERLKSFVDHADLFKMTAQAFRFVTGPILALLQVWVLCGVCNSYTRLFAAVARGELTMTEILPQMAQPTVLTGLFLLLAGRLWSWAAKLEGFQAVLLFAAFAVVAVANGPEPTALTLAIRTVLAIAVAATFYLGSNLFPSVAAKN